jgi:hypothetical protein
MGADMNPVSTGCIPWDPLFHQKKHMSNFLFRALGPSNSKYQRRIKKNSHGTKRHELTPKFQNDTRILLVICEKTEAKKVLAGFQS